MTQRERILIIDDNEVNRAVLEEILGADYELEQASTGESGIELAQRFRPDLVLLDIMMPGISGYQTCGRLRADERTKYAKIVLVSAKTTTADRLAGYNAGADDFVKKPFDADELAAKVRVFLRLKSREQLDRFKSDMLTLLAHETRTPLMVIIGALDLLKSSSSIEDGRKKEIIDMAVESCERLAQLMERSTLLTRLRDGDVKFDLQPVVVRCAFDVVRERLRALTDERAVLIRAAIDAEAVVHADPRMFGIVLHALLHNAVRFSPSPGEVVLEAAGDGPNVSIAVTDRGPGIEESYIARLFDELSPSDVAHHAQGQGLSLALTREIVRQHGGEIAIESEPERETCFTVRWPAGRVSVEDADGSRSAPAQPPQPAPVVDRRGR
jgi:signal transduction histidine kinase